MEIIHIFTRDLRIIDNISINLIAKKTVCPIFIFTPEQVSDKSKYKSSNAIQFMVDSLYDLNKMLNNNLSMYYGQIHEVLTNIIIENKKIRGISITKDYTKYAIKREDIIRSFCISNNLEFFLTEDYCLNNPSEFKPYQKYTPYKKIAMLMNIKQPKTVKLSTIKKLNSNFSFEDTKKLYTENKYINLHGGRTNGIKQLSKIKLQTNYNKNRDNLSYHTSELSAYIKFGCISIREVYYKIINTLGKSNTLISQLLWRDFYFQLGLNFPYVLEGLPLKKKYSNIKWENDEKMFNAWKNGKTGFPIVDAGMRQLNETGYMHNRARLITASFLVKTLLIDWKLGEQYFATKLYDYDPLVNNGNWQWVSGSGADSQPYFRIFNPWLQSKKHDPNCEYIKKWIPELKNIEKKHIHKWYEFNNIYGDVYMKPIVNFDLQKNKVLLAYKKIY